MDSGDALRRVGMSGAAKILVVLLVSLTFGCGETAIVFNEGQGSGGGGGSTRGEETDQEFLEGLYDDLFGGERDDDAFVSWAVFLEEDLLEEFLIDMDADSMTFRRGPAVLEEIDVQDVIVSIETEFFLIRRVVDVEVGTDEIRFGTIDGSIEDILLEYQED